MPIRFPALLLTAFFASSAQSQSLPAGIKPALQDAHIGLLDTAPLKLANGVCSDCASSPQSRWYFQHEVFAAPMAANQVAGVSAAVDHRTDVRQWAGTPAAQTLAYPSITWIGAPQLIERARLDVGGSTVTPDSGKPLPFTLAPKLASNRAYVDESTFAYFNGRALRIRGTVEQRDGHPDFVVRTIWPADFAIDGTRMPLAPLTRAVDLYEYTRKPADAAGGLQTRLVWERAPGAGRDLAGKAALGILLNGAQGDDDESIGGHFAVATGRFGAQGEWADWAVNNFYNLDTVSEKGIIAATVPMDNYLMDLNSGQQYYRPSFMLVAVLNKPRTAAAYQGAVQRTLNHFYRHELRYDGATNNCAGLSIDIFRTLGWEVPRRGPTSRLKAIAAYPYIALKQGSLRKGRGIYDYLSEETTRLLPAQAFDALGLDLLRLVDAMPGEARALTAYEQQLKEDLDAVILVQIPQTPSSRVAGGPAAFSFDDYMARVPSDQAKWQIVPVPPRPFPEALRDRASAVPAPAPLVPFPIAAIGAAGLFGGGALWRRRRRQGRAAP